jgi:KipI family sensor histidine kinase inhibitor
VRVLFAETPRRHSHSISIRTHIIPVVYDGDDLADVAQLIGISIDALIERHLAPTYTVAFLGFSRSFPYFRGVDPLLHVARLAVPRTSVPARSVAMAAGFTGVYPMSSPGGWRLLGHTTVDLFDETRDPPSALRTGDHVRFERVDP